MSTKFKCWTLGDGEIVKNVEAIHVDGDEYSAAEAYVEEQDVDGMMQGDVLVCVEDADGKQTRCTVVVDFSKTYNAYDAPLRDDPEMKP